MILKIFANCIPVKGFSQSIICDLQRNVSYFIPNELYEFIILLEKYHIDEIKQNRSTEECQVFDQYIDFLLNHEFGHLVYNQEEADLFPKLNTEWDYPSVISNAIIDIDKNSDIDFHLVFQELESLGCRSIQVRIYDEFPIEYIEGLLDSAENRTMRSIQLYIKHIPDTSDETYLDLVERKSRITGLFAHSADEDRIIRPDWAPTLTVAKITNIIDSSAHCGVVDENYFTSTIELFTESLGHNNCLNRKISLDKRGNIKNCPSMVESFGNIKDTSLKAAIAKPGFSKYWNITKDQVSVCKDCEFRYICTDCRAFLENPADINSKPLKCGYNPYTKEWSEWSLNPLKQSALGYYTELYY